MFARRYLYYGFGENGSFNGAQVSAQLIDDTQPSLKKTYSSAQVEYLISILRDADSNILSRIIALEALTQSDDVTLDSVLEIVHFIKSEQTVVNYLGASKLDKATYQQFLVQYASDLALKENKGVAAGLVDGLKAGVVDEGNTLAKLYSLIAGLQLADANQANQLLSIQNLLRSNDVNLDSIQEIVSFIKSEQTAIDYLGSNKLDKSVYQAFLDQYATDLSKKLDKATYDAFLNQYSTDLFGKLDKSTYQAFLSQYAQDMAQKEAKGTAAMLIAQLKDSVAADGDTLAKLRSLIAALQASDTSQNNQLGAINLLLQSNDVSLDTLQEIVNYIKSEQTAIDYLGSNKLDKSVYQAFLNQYATDLSGKLDKSTYQAFLTQYGTDMGKKMDNTAGNRGDITVSNNGNSWLINALAVVTAKIADLAVTAAKLADNAVTSAKLSSDASVDANRAVSTNHIKDRVISTIKIMFNAVTNKELAKMPNLTVKSNLSGDTADPQDNGALNIYDAVQGQFCDDERIAKRWWGGTFYKATGDKTVANTTAETSLVYQTAPLIGENKIYAGMTRLGDEYTLVGSGIISANSGFDAITLRIKLGSVVLANSGAIGLSNFSNRRFFIKLAVTVRSVGTTGTVIAGGICEVNGTRVQLISTGPISINTLQDQTWDLTAQWGAANANNTITLQQLKFSLI